MSKPQPQQQRDPEETTMTKMGRTTTTLRRAARRLAARPLYSAVIVLTLALGFGANTAVFSVVEGVLLSALP